MDCEFKIDDIVFCGNLKELCNPRFLGIVISIKNWVHIKKILGTVGTPNGIECFLDGSNMPGFPNVIPIRIGYSVLLLNGFVLQEWFISNIDLDHKTMYITDNKLINYQMSFDIFLLDFYGIKNNQIDLIEPKNNDNRTECYWCKAKTKRIQLCTSFADICSKCGR